MTAVTAPKPTGKDDGAMLSAFFSATPSGTDITFPTEASYRMLSEVEIKGKSFTVDASGSVFDGSDRTTPGAFLTFKQCTSFVWANSHVIGCPEGIDHAEHRHCYNVRESTGMTLENVTARRNLSGGDGIYLGDLSRDVIVDGFEIDQPSRQGLSVIFTRSVTARNGRIGNIKNLHPIDLEPLGQTSHAPESNDGVLLEDIKIGPYQYKSDRNSVNAIAGESSNVTIRRMTTEIGVPLIIHAAHAGADVVPRNHDWLIEQCGSALRVPERWYFERIDGLTIRDNVVPFATALQKNPVRTDNCTKVSVTGNNWR